MTLLKIGVEALERGVVPDRAARIAIRNLCRKRLSECRASELRARSLGEVRFEHSLRNGPIALLPSQANAQHYELPPEFFAEFLGSQRKYSCCYWEDGSTLDKAEEAALDVTCERAELADGQDVLELGCGWGSLSLYMAERYPHSRIVAVSNSSSQGGYIRSRAAVLGLANLHVVTADINDFAPPGGLATCDRIVSVEMFEHVRNFDLLLGRIAGWLRPAGKLFVHHFCHRQYCYPFENSGADNWMGRHFFTGGIMPSSGLLGEFSRDLTVSREWEWNGTHYQRTANAWLGLFDERREVIDPILERVYGARDRDRWRHRWRMFLLAVSELFGYAGGRGWLVKHALLERRN